MALDQYLTLARYFHSLFGAPNFEGLKDLLRTCPEERDEEGISQFCRWLLSSHGLQIPHETLKGYDSRINAYEDDLRAARQDFRSFRYFQYLALLYTETYLDRLTSDPEGFAATLSAFASEQGGVTGQPFTKKDLRRLAFFMATGSGKTLLLHVHIRQFWHYLKEGRHPEGLVARRDARREFDQILLITPNAGLSDQHLRELRASGIDATLLIEDRESGTGRFWPKVKVIEIHKLAEEVSGDGVSVALDELGSANLVFVDEGHKGTGTEARTWKTRQQKLSEDGFLVEYSATFAQAIAAAGGAVRQDLTSEYGRCILFDYSYRHFFGDGYGKTFQVLNASNASDDRADEMLLGGLLVFYQQVRLFGEKREELRAYNLESPLWILLGTSVSKSQGRRADNSLAARSERTDVARVIGFLRRFLEDREWASRCISAFLEGRSDFRSREAGQDLFARTLESLKKTFDSGSVSDLYSDICRDVFHGTGGLEVWEIRSAEGEFGLRVSGPQGDVSQYFGVVNIGDALSFRKHIEERLKLTVRTDSQRGSLFASVDSAESGVRLLIGAKKFIEGWSSWRVSAMGLMNIGRGEGSQIMQLFGRGIRLKGRDMSLKRSDFVEARSSQPEGIRRLETLYVFGWNADYMARFQGMINAEEIPVFRDLPVFPNPKWPKKGMYVPKPAEERNVLSETFVFDAETGVDVDLTARLTTYIGNAEGQGLASQRAEGKRVAFRDARHLLDVGALYAAGLEYAASPGPNMGNTFLTRERFGKLLDRCGALVPEEDLENRHVLQSAAAQAVCQAIRRGFHRWERSLMNSDMAPRELSVGEATPTWRIQVPLHTDLLAKIEELIKKPLENFDSEEPIPRLYVDWHLYNPLFRRMKETSGGHLIPPGLVESEERFLKDLRQFWKREENTAKYLPWRLYVLRNPSPSGVTLFGETGRFIPDFILWLRHTKSKRTLVRFVEPHGLHHESEAKARNKAQCLMHLEALSKQKAFKKKAMEMDGWILSPTEKLADIPWAGKRSWGDLRREFRVLLMNQVYLPTVLNVP
ncbi:MAG: DEAD/DEAH box helicase family protein [Thermodesulfobacteriota bacterium]